MNDEIPEGLRVPMISRRRMLQLSALGVGSFSATSLLAAAASSASKGIGFRPQVRITRLAR